MVLNSIASLLMLAVGEPKILWESPSPLLIDGTGAHMCTQWCMEYSLSTKKPFSLYGFTNWAMKRRDGGQTEDIIKEQFFDFCASQGDASLKINILNDVDSIKKESTINWITFYDKCGKNTAFGQDAHTASLIVSYSKNKVIILSPALYGTKNFTQSITEQELRSRFGGWAVKIE